MDKFIGTGVALVTPFKQDKSVDHEALERLVEFQVENGVDYLVVLGTTAENATLNREERSAVMQTIKKANDGRLPMVLGMGGNDTRLLANHLERMDLSDYDAILSVSPYYSRPTQEGIYQHYKELSAKSPLPIILYNVPSRTGSNVLPETVIRLANECENIIGIKEAAGDMVQAMKLIKYTPNDFLVISGDDMLALPIVLAGGAGVISVIGQGLPRAFSDCMRLGIKGKVTEAYKLHYRIAPSIDLIFAQGNPAGIKCLLSRKGVIQNHLRLPLVPVDEQLSGQIGEFLEYFEE